MVNNRFIAVAVLAAIVCLVGASEHGRIASAQRFVVGVDSGTSLEAVVAGIDHLGLNASRLDGLHALEVTAAPSAQARIASVAGVRYVEPVVAVRSADAPNDPLYGQESSYLSKINASAAWDITTGSANIVVAVVDTGVDVRHPDLQPNIWFNARETANNGADDDGNGCVDDVNGCAFVSDSAPGCSNITNGFINDDIGHGTFVAGIIAAVGNGQGMVGVARNVRIMPVKVLDCYGSGDSVAAARGIQYAARNGAKVINLSLGGLENAQVMRDAVIEAMSLGSIVIAASGNGGGPGVAFPAAFPESLAVAAAAPGGDTRASFSSYGPEVDVAAVGEDVVGTMASTRCGVFIPCIGNTPYAAGDGTSFSTPQVSGLAALMYSLNPNLTAFQVTDIIRNSATALAPGSAPNWAGAGRINMVAALQAVQGNHPPGEACVIASVADGESFTCTSGRSIRMLQMDAPDVGQCGGQWATDALRNIFLTLGRTVYLRFDVTRGDAQGRTLAAPLWRGADGQDYNISIIMVYVGLARAADVGATNTTFHDWSFASETWAKAASWNMWAAGKPFAGGC